MQSPNNINAGQLVRREKPKDSGCECAYIHVDGYSWGVRVYAEREQAEKGYRRQKELFDIGLAPEPHTKATTFDIYDKFGFTRYVYGYATEHCEEILRYHVDGSFEWWNQRDWQEMFADFVDSLAEKTEYGFLTDFHSKNFALKDDVLQLIDMGCLVLDETEDEEIYEWDHVDLRGSQTFGYPVLVNCPSVWPRSEMGEV